MEKEDHDIEEDDGNVANDEVAEDDVVEMRWRMMILRMMT